MPISSTAEERVRTSPEPQQLEASAEHRKKSPLEKKRLTMTAAAGRMQKERKVTVSKHKARTDASEKKATTMKVGGVDASKLENVLFKTCIDWSYSVPKKKKKKKIQTKIASVHPTQEDGDETAAPPVKRPNKRSPLFTSDRNSGKERYYPDGCDD
ncbi:hypothetical protein Y032_0009g432 [Ancylostoma ceylanicum]|nr:hypothetical protein Y032_0009g432 [Ancylostoma ceylanicum]